VKLPNSVAVMESLFSSISSRKFAINALASEPDILLEHQILNCNSCFGQTMRSTNCFDVFVLDVKWFYIYFSILEGDRSFTSFKLILHL
jgi:hypothetical protein